MSHKITMTSLVLDFKRANEGKGVLAARALTALTAFSLAYTAPLPDNGVTGSLEAAQTLLRPFMKILVSDINELMMVDLGSIEDVTTALYCNRYETVYGGYRALESFSLKQIIVEGIGEDVWDTVTLWAPRFLEAIKLALFELKGNA